MAQLLMDHSILTRCALLLGVLAQTVLAAPEASSIDVQDTRLASEPAICQQYVAFAYANDLWIAERDGLEVRRLTSHPGVEFGPHFSPDGSLVAFTGRYEGNTD